MFAGETELHHMIVEKLLFRTNISFLSEEIDILYRVTVQV